MIAMKSKTDFHNARIVKADGTHMVRAGDRFETDWLHAKELVAGGLAEAEDPKAMDREPADAVDPHHGLSAPDHAAITKRRGATTVTAPIDRTKAAAAALDKVRATRAALVKAEQAAKDKPGPDSEAKLATAQSEHAGAENEARAFAA